MVCERSLELMIPFKDMGNKFSGNSKEGLANSTKVDNPQFLPRIWETIQEE